jgi:hypothetical protein
MRFFSLFSVLTLLAVGCVHSQERPRDNEASPEIMKALDDNGIMASLVRDRPAKYNIAAEPTFQERVSAIEAQAKAGAQAGLNCAGTPLSEVHSISELPQEVIALLVRNESGSGVDEIVDRGQQFNSGDIGGGPSRRFVVAGKSDNCLTVAVEHGGYGYHMDVFSLN